MARTFVAASSQYLSRASAVVSSPPWTIVGWAYPANVTEYMSLVDVTSTTSVNMQRLIGRGDQPGDYITLYRNTGGSYQTTNSPGAFAVAWSHWGGTQSTAAKNTGVVYLDGTGTADASAGSLTIANLNQTSIGAALYYGSSRSYTNITAAEVALYSVVLTASEVAALAKRIQPTMVRPDAIAAYWSLGVRQGATDNDQWKNRNDLTPYGSPTWTTHPLTYYPRLAL